MDNVEDAPLTIDCRDVTFPRLDRVIWSQPKPKFTWLYVVECSGYSKVGLATNPVCRLATLTGACPIDMVLFNAYRVPMAVARLSEAWCHRKLTALHHRAEWFAVGPEEAIKVVLAVAEKACQARRSKTKALFKPEDCRRVYPLSAPPIVRWPDKPVWVPIRGEPDWVPPSRPVENSHAPQA